MTIDHTLVAKWTKAISITYDANGGTGTVPSTQSGIIYSPETSVTLTIGNDTELTKSGYNFLGWSTNKDATASMYTAGGTIVLSDSVTLYATWEGINTGTGTGTGTGEVIIDGILLSSVVSIGDYVRYTPSTTSYTVSSSISGYTSDQIFKPSEQTLWQVYNINGDNTVELINATREKLTLAGETGYNEGKTILQTLAQEYNNPFYAKGARVLGVTDIYYEEDKARFASYNYDIGSAWTAKTWDYSNAAYYGNGTLAGYFTEYGLTGTDGSQKELYETGYRPNTSTSSLYTTPVITLKSKITVSSGNGTKVAPYNINGYDSHYTITYDANNGSGQTDTQLVIKESTVTLKSNTFTRSGYIFRGWGVTDDATKGFYEGQEVVLTGNITLYAIWGDANTLVNRVSIGDYITYTPDLTNYIVATSDSGHTSEQTFNPSTATNWKVININEDDTIDIISTSSVGNLTLTGTTGYRRAVQTLQDISKAYLNPNYAVGAKHMGYSEEGLTSEEIENYKVLPSGCVSDSQYTFTQIDTSVTNVWLASRDYYRASYAPYNEYGRIRYINYAGSVSVSDYLFTSYNTSALTYGVRPVITLEVGLKIASGEGTSSSPYVLESRHIANRISYNANGGTGFMEEDITTHGSNVTLSTNEFTREYYTFKGWSTTSTGSVVYTDGQTVSLSGNITLYAVWERIKYTMTFNANGGSGSMASQTGEAGANMTLNANTFTKSGYSFAGWATSANGSVAYNNNHTFIPTQNMTLYAVWGRTITFNANGGTGTMTDQVLKENVQGTIKGNSFTRTGYSFAGWATSANGSVAYNNYGSITLTDNITLYAKWQLVLSYSLPMGSISSQSYTLASTSETSHKFTISSTTTVRGFQITGWSTSSTATSASYSSGGTITISQNTTLYAIGKNTCYCCGSTSASYTRYDHKYCYTCSRKTICRTNLYCSGCKSEYSGCSSHSCANECWIHGYGSTLNSYCDYHAVYYCDNCDYSSSSSTDHECDCCGDCYGYCSCTNTYYCDTCMGTYCDSDPCGC